MLTMDETVQVREGTITLPSYRIKGVNRNPVSDLNTA